MPQRTKTNVPADQVGMVVQLFVDEGCTEVNAVKANGTWTVTGKKPG